MRERACSRRTLLRRTTAATTVGALASTAGCLGLLADDSTTYTDWMPASTVLGYEDGYRFEFHDHEARRAAAEPFEDPDIYYGAFAIGPANYEDFTQSMHVAEMQVHDGDFDPDRWASFSGEAMEKRTESAGYSIHVMDIGIGLALSEDRIIVALPEGTLPPVERIEALLATKTGDANRFLATNEHLQVLVDELGNPSTLYGDMKTDAYHDPEIGSFENDVAKGETTTFDGSTVDKKWVVLYDSEADVNLNDLERWVEGTGGFHDFDDLSQSDVDIEQSGRAGIITATVPTSEYF